jgi:hypothetical protein
LGELPASVPFPAFYGVEYFDHGTANLLRADRR